VPCTCALQGEGIEKRGYGLVSEHLSAENEDNHGTSQLTQLSELNWTARLPEFKDGILAPDRKFESFLTDIRARHAQDVHRQ
jgi:hypothetical protein